MPISVKRTVWGLFQGHIEEALQHIEGSRYPVRAILLVSDDEDYVYAAAVLLEVIFQSNHRPDARRVHYRFDQKCRHSAVERLLSLARKFSEVRARFLNRLVLEILGDAPLPRIPLWSQVVPYLVHLARRRPYDDGLPSAEVRHLAQRILVILIAKGVAEGRRASSKGLTRHVLGLIGHAITEEAGVHPPALL